MLHSESMDNTEQARDIAKELAQMGPAMIAGAVLLRLDKLAQHGWIIPMHMSLPELQQLVLQDSPTNQWVDDWFVEYYRQNGRSDNLIKGLISSGRLAFWTPLIEQCGRAFESKDYGICVPSLWLVLDGVIAKLWHTKLRNKKERHKFFQRKIHESNPKSALGHMWNSVQVFIDQAFQDNVRPGRKYKRNLEMHGLSDPTTWGEAHCLRLLQSISTVVSLQSAMDRSRTEKTNPPSTG